jgi:hypothetical protein
MITLEFRDIMVPPFFLSSDGVMGGLVVVVVVSAASMHPHFHPAIKSAGIILFGRRSSV